MVSSYRGLITLCAGLLFVLAHNTAQGAALYGLLEEVQLVGIDPHTYNVTTIGNTTLGRLLDRGHASIDAKNGIYYFRGFKNNTKESLIGLSLKDGTVVKNVVLPFIARGGFCEVDPTSGDVFVTGPLDQYGYIYVMRIDMKTGLFVNVSMLNLPMGRLSAFDSQAKVLYVELYESTNQHWIYAIDVVTGKTISKIAVNLKNFFETMHYDPVTGKIFGIGFNATNSDYSRCTLLSLDLKTGKFTQISVISGYVVYSGAIAALDVKARTLSAFLNGDNWDLVSVNIDTGKIMYTTPACDELSECPWSLEYGL